MLGIVAGSGIDLLPLLHRVTWERPFADFEGLTESTVAGHASRFVAGIMCHADFGEVELVLQLGRRHAYEGLSLAETVRTVEVLQSFGVDKLLLTSAAGGVDTSLRVGDIVSAHRVYAWPYQRFSLPESLTPDFEIPETDASGLHAFLHGPSYESPAEIRALQGLGVATVGMSTAPEMYRCKQLGIAVGALSVVTNQCSMPQTLSHQEVLGAAKAASQRLRDILITSLSGI